MPHLHPPFAASRRGFTLIELLAVLIVMTVVMTLTVPSVRSMIQSYQIKQAGIMFQSKLAEARQIAFSLNRPVQVRLCGPSSSTAAPYKTIQIFSIDSTGKPAPVGRAATLPPGVCIASDPTYTSVLSLSELLTTADDPLVGALGKTYAYRKFNVYPSGTTDLNPEAKWFMTIGDDRSNSAGKRPANFATVQIDPVNATSTVYNP